MVDTAPETEQNVVPETFTSVPVIDTSLRFITTNPEHELYDEELIDRITSRIKPFPSRPSSTLQL